MRASTSSYVEGVSSAKRPATVLSKNCWKARTTLGGTAEFGPPPHGKILPRCHSRGGGGGSGAGSVWPEQGCSQPHTLGRHTGLDVQGSGKVPQPSGRQDLLVVGKAPALHAEPPEPLRHLHAGRSVS